MNIQKNNFLDALKNALEVVKLNDVQITKQSQKKDLDVFGMLIVIAPFVVAWLLMAVGMYSFMSFYAFSYMLVSLAALLSMFFFVCLGAKLMFKVNIKFPEVFNVMSYASLVNCLMVLPYLFAIIGAYGLTRLTNIFTFAYLWALVVANTYLMKNKKLEMEKSIAVVVVAGIGAYIVARILAYVLIGHSVYMF